MKSCSSTGNLDTVYRLSCDLEQDARTAAVCVVRHRLGSAFCFVLQWPFVSKACT